jgi:Tol biopolymer transport system component
LVWRLLGWVTAPATSQTSSQANVAFDVSPDGRQVVFTDVQGDLYLLQLATRKVVRLTATDAVEARPAFSPDGKSIAYSAAIPGSTYPALWIRSVDGTKARQLTRGIDGGDGSPSFLADGRSLVFARSIRIPQSAGGSTWSSDVYLIERDGRGLRRITRQCYFSVDSPRVNSIGPAVVYAGMSTPLDHGMLLKAELSGTTPPRAIGLPRPPGYHGGAWASSPHLARDDKTLVFLSDRNQAYRYDLFLANGDGTGARPLGVTRLGSYNQHPVLLPEGKGVLFLGNETHYHQPTFALYRVDLDGSNLRLLADGGLFIRPLHWPAEPDRAQPHPL